MLGNEDLMWPIFMFFEPDLYFRDVSLGLEPATAQALLPP